VIARKNIQTYKYGEKQQKAKEKINHFYLIGSKSYQIRGNNAKYTVITPFKAIQGH